MVILDIVYKCGCKKGNDGIIYPQIQDIKDIKFEYSWNTFFKKEGYFHCQIRADSIEHKKIQETDGIEIIKKIL